MKGGAQKIALGGVTAALAVTLLCLGSLLVVATYVTPMLCMFLLQVVSARCGRRIGWAWYGAVAVLALLLVPDREAAAVFIFLGDYPLIKPMLDGKKLAWLYKAVLFNGMTLLMYVLLIRLFGMDAVADEFRELGTALTVVMLLIGNVVFLLLDRLLGRDFFKKLRGRS